MPHLHRGFEESFYVLDGRFIFTLGEQEREATPGTYILVPRSTAHTITADDGGGRFLTLMVPGGLEDMFFELGQLGADALRDPAARAAVSARYDSIPVPVTLQELQPPEANSPVGGYVMASRCANLLGQARGVRQLDSRVRRSAPRRERRDRHAAAALRRGRREAARSSVGVAGLPLGFAVEIETVVEVDADLAAGQSVSP